MEEQLLKEYVGTYLNPKYNGDWDVVNSKFPELSGVDKEILKEYVGTYLNPKYNGDWNVVNSKFPELFPAGKSSAERPAEPVKKKEDTVSPFVDGGSELTKFDPTTGKVVQETPEFTKPKEKDFSGLEVKVQDEKILTKQPRQEKPLVATESTTVVSPKTVQPTQPEKKGAKSYLENIAINLGLGASYANEAVASIPESIVNILAIPQNYIAEKTGLPIGVTAEGIKESWGITNPLLDYVKEDQKILSGEVSKFIADRYEDPSIVGNFEKGNYQEGFELLGSAITQSLPISVGLMIGGAYTAPSKLATVATLGFTEDQREELADMDPTMSEAEKTLKAAGMAGMESVFSSIGTGTLGRVYKDIAKREGTETAKKIFTDGLITAYETALKKGGLPVAVAGNSLEEGAVRVSQNVISGRPIMDGVADAFITGGGSGVVFGAPISAVNAKRYIENKITSYDTKSKVTEILKDKADNMAQVYNVPVSSEINVSQLEIANLPNSRNLLINNLKKSVSDGQITEEDAKQSLFVFDKVQQVSNAVKDLNISIDDKAKVASLLRQRDDLKTKIQNKDDVLVVQEKRKIEEINNQIQSIISKPKSTYKVDGKEVSVDAIDELIKTKSKDELLAMNIEINNDQTGLTERLQSVLETKPVEQDAIQKQAAGEVPVQPGATVSEEVEQGVPQAEPQGVAEEGQEEVKVGSIFKWDVFGNEDTGDWTVVDETTTRGGKPAVTLSKVYVEDIANGKTYTKEYADKNGIRYENEFTVTHIVPLNELKTESFTQISEPQVVAEEGQVQEEVIPQEEIDLETQLAEDLKTIKDTTKPRLRVEGIDIPAEEDINLETIESNLDKLPAYEVNFTTPEVSQDIQVNPIEESKSSTKEGTAESRTIESFQGVPMIVGMSDTLAAGTVVDSMGNPMEVEGGLLYNVLGKNKNAAWAGVTEEGARIQYNEALELYNNNKNLFEKLWAEGKLPNGHVPMAIMRMADTAVNSNEAVFRYLSPLVKSQPEANQQAALDALKGDIEVKKKVKQEATVKSANKLDQFISSKNINSLGQLLDAMVSDANSRAKGDTENTLSLSERSLLFDLMVSPKGTKAASKNTVNALFGAKKDPKSKAFLADNIYEAIGEPAMLRIPRGNVAAVVGVDVLNGGVVPVEHGNYGFGPKGQMISLISNPKHGLDVFPEWKAKAVRVFKKTNTKQGEGKLPTASAIADEVGGAFFIDSAFRNAKVSMEPSDIELLAAKLRFAFPDVTVSNSQEEFDRVLQEEGVRTKESDGKVILGLTKDGKVYLNPDSDSLATPIHEFGHIWIDFLRSEVSKEKGDALLAKGLSLVEGTKALQQAIAKYGDNALAREEALVELMATKGEDIINKSKKKEFKNWLNALFKYVKEFFTTTEQLFKDKEFKKILQEMSLDDFINIGLADLLKGKAISSEFKAKDAGKGATELRFRVGDNVTNFISKARAQGFSEAAIKNVLTRSGVDTDAINEALAKDTPAAKKVEVTEEFAPGYNRVLNNMFGEKGVVAKSRRRGVSEEDTIQNAINYLEGTKVYENATDVQREAMVRNVNKELKKREKSAPTAKRVLGQKKDVVTITVDLAKERDRIIKEQIKLAKEVTGNLNDKRAALADAIRMFEDGGVITTAQTKTIVNRISKVNLNNPIMVDRLLAYIEKVFDNANYAADMADLRKLQRQARTKKHTSMKDFVDRFTSINPELIPLDRIQDYKESLDFLNNRTPSYSRMNEMLPEIESYQVSEEFDSVKTIEGLNNKYESIALNEVKSVEDYVNLIKDINSFKRKAFQLLQNEAITQEEYDNLIDMVGKDQAEIEKRYEKEITQIKKDLIAEIKKQRPKNNAEFTKEENDLIKEYLELSNADLESLSPEDLFVLNDLLENVSNGEIDYYRFKNVVSKAANNKAGVEVGKQLKGSKLSLGSAKLREEMAKFESSFWEGLLGLGRATSGPLQKFIISPFNRAIGSYEKFTRDGYNDFLNLKKKYKIDDSKLVKSTKQMSKIGMLTTYLQEYMAQFDANNKGVKDIGKRDWFKEILATETMRDDYSPEELKIIEEIHKSLPKDNDGNVDPKAVYDSYMANDGKFFTKNEKGFFDEVMEWKKNNSTSKQKAANEMSGNAFKEIPFHMLRSRYAGQTSQITPATSGDNGMVRIKAGTGKERASEAVGAINTNFEKLFIKGLEQTGRDYFLSKTLKDINNVLASAKKELAGDKDPLVKAISYTLSDALAYEFSNTASQNLLKRLVQARAAMTLLDPIRAGVEFTSTLLSFGLRARTLSGYKNLFGSQGDMRNLLEFTDSPLRLRQNINNAIDINDGRIEPQGMFMKWTTFLSGLPERTMMVTSWMPTFTNEFQTVTGEKFDMKKFNDSEAYREKYGKAIKEASAVADAQTEKIIGPTTKAGQRRDILIFPGKTVGRDTVSGQILGFFSNYPYREITEFVNGFKEAGEVLKKGDSVEAISQLQKPLGIALNVAAYGFLSSVVYASRLILLGDEDEEERGNKLLEELMTAKGFIEETSANAAALAASKYAGGGRAILQILGTLGIMLTDNEETKATIKKMLKGSVYVDPLPTQKLSGYGTADKVNTAIIKFIPQFVVLSNAIIDGLGGLNEIKAIYDKVEKKGIEALTEDEELKVLAMSVLFTGTQLYLNYKGTSLPSYNNLKAGMKAVKEEAGVADISDGKVPAKKKSSGGRGSSGGGRAKTINKTDLKKYNRELYNEMYGPGSAAYEIEQEVKAFEKEQREFKKKMKDQVYGGD